MDGRPLDVLEESLQSAVTVRLKDGEEYNGVLAGYDQHMNVVLVPPEEAEEFEPTTETAASSDEFGPAPVEDTMVIRGDNVVTIET
jgi:small nuclear ribonucleoprotein